MPSSAMANVKKAKKATMNWNAVTGSGGRAKIGIKTYEGKQYNEIKKFMSLKDRTGLWRKGFAH